MKRKTNAIDKKFWGSTKKAKETLGLLHFVFLMLNEARLNKQ
jgi:hypothetical protein